VLTNLGCAKTNWIDCCVQIINDVHFTLVDENVRILVVAIVGKWNCSHSCWLVNAISQLQSSLWLWWKLCQF